MNFNEFEVPAPVLTVIICAPAGGEPGGALGTMARQVVWFGHATVAWAAPNRTTISPSELNSPAPARVTSWPGAPDAGETIESCGLPVAAGFPGEAGPVAAGAGGALELLDEGAGTAAGAADAGATLTELAGAGAPPP